MSIFLNVIYYVGLCIAALFSVAIFIEVYLTILTGVMRLFLSFCKLIAYMEKQANRVLRI